jgi:hypothetical protein
MAISFPGSKSNGQKFTAGNKSWTWNGSSWKGSTTTGGDATTFDSLDSSQFLRSDTNDGTTGNLSVGTTSTFTTGGTARLTLSASSVLLSAGASNSDMFYIRRQSAGNFAWQSYNGGNSGTIQLQPYGGNVGIGTTSPSQKLDVAGNIAVSGTVDGRDVSVDGSKLDGIESGATADQTAAQLLTAIKTVDGSSSGLDADLLDGWHQNEIVPYQSGSDFPLGTLVTTNINSSGTNGDSFVIQVTGKAYGSSRPHTIIAEGYLYNNTVISTGGTNIAGSNFTYLKVMNNNGVLSFWWPRHGYWNSYDVHVRSSSAGTNSKNRVTAITNSSDPSGATKKIQINLAKSWNDANDGSGSGLDADTLDGLHASDLGGGATVSTTAPSSPSQGDMWFNSTTGVTAMYVWSGTQWDQMSNKFSATGGTVTTYSAGGLNYKIHTFTSSGTFVADAAGVVDILMVAGGGGGGGHANPGGAGAGGLIYISSHGVTPGSFTITIGAGGVNTNTGTYATAVKGNDTTGIGLTAKGGGAGVVWSAANLASLNGGSSGGYGTGGSVNTGASTATQPTQSGDSGVHGFGNRGGNGTYFGNPYPGGGGGGAGAVGQNSPGGSTAGAGGAGRTYDISGTSTTYAGGGGGGGWSSVSGMAGGAGGGGRGDCALSGGTGTSSRGFTNNSSIGENGSINTGGGGGGAGRTGGQLSRGGNGGSGIVIIRYLV